MNRMRSARSPIRHGTRPRTLRPALAGLLDLIDKPLLVCTSDGTEQHRNRALVLLLQNECAAKELVGEMYRMARQLQATLHVGPCSADAMQHETQTPSARYVLRASLAPSHLFPPHGIALIEVERLKPRSAALPDPEALRLRYGLTRREAEVTLLLAEGLTNDQIAERLFVSPHTARRHTENVLEKLDLRSRKALALKLLHDLAASDGSC